MTLAVVHAFSAPILKALHGVSFEAATLTAYMLCGAAGMLAATGFAVGIGGPSRDIMI